MAKATITSLTRSGSEGAQVVVMFNPKELTFSKTNSWKQDDSPKNNLPATEFTSGGARSLKMQLYFDTFKNSEDGKAKDVRLNYTDKLCAMMDVDPAWTDKKNKKGRPPNVGFQWGKWVVFDAVIASISQRFTLFSQEDTPVRAVLDVTFTEIKDKTYKPNQNPTSGGMGGERVWIVREGDTLPWIAFAEYNDPNGWRAIADANLLTQVRRLTPGMTLVIPNA